MDIFERVYYMRAIIGVVAGLVIGFVINSAVPFDPALQNQGMSVGIAFGMAILFYIVSYGIGKGIAKNVPKDKRRKIATEGIIPFIFLLIVFMVMVYTGFHQCDPRLNMPNCQS